MKNKSVVLTPNNFKKVTGIHITTDHQGKMSGMQSLSTSCLCNPQCKKYSEDPNKICSKCYAQRQMKMYKSMGVCLERNSKLLTEKVLKTDEMPVLNVCYFRFEAFGDLINDIQVANYFNICNANPDTHFALWTKNPHIIQMAMDKGYKKPKNLQIVLSSPFLNKAVGKGSYEFIDKIFTVYDKDYIEEHNMEINCGAKSCLKCKKCYKKSSLVFVNEKLK